MLKFQIFSVDKFNSGINSLSVFYPPSLSAMINLQYINLIKEKFQKICSNLKIPILEISYSLV